MLKWKNTCMAHQLRTVHVWKSIQISMEIKVDVGFQKSQEFISGSRCLLPKPAKSTRGWALAAPRFKYLAATPPAGTDWMAGPPLGGAPTQRCQCGQTAWSRALISTPNWITAGAKAHPQCLPSVKVSGIVELELVQCLWSSQQTMVRSISVCLLLHTE